MRTEIIPAKGSNIAEITADEILIRTTQDALDLMVNCVYNGADRIILHEKNIAPEFFDLKTRLAGDILQKFSNYRARLAIVGHFEEEQEGDLLRVGHVRKTVVPQDVGEIPGFGDDILGGGAHWKVLFM